jgi:hypothetical protein
MGSSPMPEVLDPEALPPWLDRQTYASWYRMHLGYHIVALAAFGGIVGWSQSRRLGEYVPAQSWVVATAVGFAAILCVEAIERHIVVGPHAGPIEPLMISVGGSSLAGLAQWIVLRQRGVNASRWLASWIIGVVVGVCAAVGVIMGLEAVLVKGPLTGVVAQAVAWGCMLLLLGLVTGAVAGAISARALNSSLAGRAA